MKKHKNVFKYIHGLFVGVCVLIVIGFSVQYSFDKDNVERNIDIAVDLMVDGIQENLSSIDKLYNALEMHADTTLKEALNEMNTAYEAGELTQEALDDICNGYDHVNLYVIDTDNVVVMTTLENDLGLDFTRYETYTAFFNELRLRQNYVSDRTSIGLKTEQLTKYSYLSTSDGKYILDASYDMQSFDVLLEGNSFLEYKSDIIMATEYILELELIEAYNDMQERAMRIYPMDQVDELQAITKAKQTGEVVRITAFEGYYTVKSVFIPFVLEHRNGADSVFIYKLTYSNEEILKKYNEAYITIGLLFFIGILIFISLAHYYNAKTLRPIFKLLKSFVAVREENFKIQLEPEGSKPVKEAIVTFNEMVASINTLIIDKEEVEGNLRRHLKQSELGYVNTVTAMANAIDAKDNYTGGHCERVMNMSLLLADYVGLSTSQVKDLMYASLLHDIGKIGINDAILNKKEKFTKEDYEMMKKHPTIGYKILQDVEFLEEANKAILYHHERVDGKGYPHGLKGHDIPYLGRLLCITDAFDAMTSRRIYRDSVMTVRDAFDELERCSGTQFDFDLVYQFKQAYEESYGRELNHFADEIE